MTSYLQKRGPRDKAPYMSKVKEVFRDNKVKLLNGIVADHVAGCKIGDDVMVFPGKAFAKVIKVDDSAKV